jgi:hypothetical protein
VRTNKNDARATIAFDTILLKGERPFDTSAVSDAIVATGGSLWIEVRLSRFQELIELQEYRTRDDGNRMYVQTDE